MKNTKLSWFIAIILISAIGYFLFIRSGSEPTDSNNPVSVQESEENPKTPLSPEEEAIASQPDLIIGNPDAPITITEFADFKCPTCGRFEKGAFREIYKEYIETGKAKLVFRGFPFIAEDSTTAIAGAYCANKQGKFKEYHDRLFSYIDTNYYAKGAIAEGEAVPSFSVNNLPKVLESSSINSEELIRCISAGEVAASLDADKQAAEFRGIRGTPTIVIGGEEIVGAQPYAVYKKLLEAQ